MGLGLQVHVGDFYFGDLSVGCFGGVGRGWCLGDLDDLVLFVYGG